jgi:hypothetical protein
LKKQIEKTKPRPAPPAASIELGRGQRLETALFSIKSGCGLPGGLGYMPESEL